MIYPIPGPHRFTDTFLAPRGGGTRRHHGNDLMAPKMTPLLAVFDGTVTFAQKKGTSGNTLTLRSDDGWTATYMHINNDTPGTDDGKGSARYAFLADLLPGARVRAGEVVAWCGDSGNAEGTGPHVHFELYDAEGGDAILTPRTRSSRPPESTCLATRTLPGPRGGGGRGPLGRRRRRVEHSQAHDRRGADGAPAARETGRREPQAKAGLPRHSPEASLRDRAEGGPPLTLESPHGGLPSRSSGKCGKASCSSAKGRWPDSLLPPDEEVAGRGNRWKDPSCGRSLRA